MNGLLARITSTNNAEFYSLNWLHSFTTNDKLKNDKDVCKNPDYCCIEMPKEDNKILKYNRGEKSIKVPFIVYADLESLLEKLSTCHNNAKKSPRTKINKRTSSGYSLFTHFSFDAGKKILIIIEVMVV